MPRYKLRTLLIVLALGPMVLAWGTQIQSDTNTQRVTDNNDAKVLISNQASPGNSVSPLPWYAAPLAEATLEFPSPALAHRFRCFDKASTEVHASGFQRLPYGQYNSAVSTTWARNCSFDGPREFTLPLAEWK